MFWETPVNFSRIFVSAVLAFVFAVTALASTASAQEKRFALVIGNSDYSGKIMSPLKNPGNDAALIADSLKRVNFSVNLLLNADQRTMKKAVSAFTKKVSEAGPDAIALFYYAGHGFQANNLNYLAPLGAELQEEADAEFEAMSVDWVLARMEAAHGGANIVILDACRNNALRKSNRSAGQGLALLKSTPIGSFISYSTAPGSTALDGSGLNSPYTAAIAREIIQPGTSIEQAFKNVRKSVISQTEGSQVPWDYSSLTTEVVFTPSNDVVAVAQSLGKAATDAMQLELQLWNDVKNSDKTSNIQSYVDKYPQGAFVAIAKSLIEDIEKAANPDIAAKETDTQFAALTQSARVVETPSRPHEYYANARLFEIQGDYPKARQNYLKFFAFGESKVDPHYRFQSFLRVQEGREGAKEFYNSLSQGRRDPILQFATALLNERGQRIERLSSFIEQNPNFGPAYYELSLDYSAARLGQQSLADKKSEHKLLKQFIEQADNGRVLRYFLDQQVLTKQMDDAKTRLASLSFLDETALENPVKLSPQRTNQGWMINLAIADQTTEIFVAHSGKPPVSTGFVQGAVNPQNGKPVPFPMFELPGNAETMPLEVTYLDVRGQMQGPFKLIFNPATALIEGQKNILNQFSNAWIGYRLYDGKLLAYFTHLSSYKCAIEKVEYAVDSDMPDKIFKLDKCDPNNPFNVSASSDLSKILITLPKKSKYMTVRLTFKDGTQTDVKRFDVVTN